MFLISLSAGHYVPVCWYVRRLPPHVLVLTYRGGITDCRMGRKSDKNNYSSFKGPILEKDDFWVSCPTRRILTLCRLRVGLLLRGASMWRVRNSYRLDLLRFLHFQVLVFLCITLFIQTECVPQVILSMVWNQIQSTQEHKHHEKTQRHFLPRHITPYETNLFLY